MKLLIIASVMLVAVYLASITALWVALWVALPVVALVWLGLVFRFTSNYA